MRLLYLFTGVLMLAACHHPKTRIPAATNMPMPETVKASNPAVIEPTRTVTSPSKDVVRLSAVDDSARDDNATPDAIGKVNGLLKDVYFGYDRADLSDEASAALLGDAKLLAGILAQFPGLKVSVEGHCDERGSAEYNLALGDVRAKSAAEALRDSGVPPAVLETVSYGKEKPQCTESTESCWQKNRRAHIVVR